MGKSVDVDIRGELERYSWQRARWTEDKLISCSPFRYQDSRPSFFVNLENSIYAGTWKDSGALDSDYESGGFVRLLSFLREEDETSTENYLISEYSSDWEYGKKLEIPKISINSKKDRHINETVLEQYKYRHNYLASRGISENVQRLMRIGYDLESKAITIPWFDSSGRLANIKYRRVDSKLFWYYKGESVPIKNLVYGIDIVQKIKAHEVILVEAEIDALTWMTVGKPAIAVAGSTISDEQVDIIKRSYIEKLIICADNDEAGRKLKEKVVKKLRGSLEMANIDLPVQWKDVNESHQNTDIKEFYNKNVHIRQINRLNVDKFVRL